MITRRPARRGVLRALFALTATVFTGGALAHVVTTPHGRPYGRGETRGQGEAGGPEGSSGERYKGRWLQVVSAPAAHDGEFDVLVDGRPLHLMRCADGGYLSPVDHYQSYPTPLEAARAAVDELGSARLVHAVAHGTGL